MTQVTVGFIMKNIWQEEQKMNKEFNTDEGRDWVRGLLKEQEIIVTFSKVNGDERVMTCTLKEGVIPAPTKTDELSKKKVRQVDADKVCSVWDINAKGWRSFRWENVKK